MKKIFIPLVFLTLLSHLNAQNYIFEEGQSGFSFDGLYITSNTMVYQVHPMEFIPGTP